MTATNILLKVTGLKVSYGGIQAVKGVDFEVREGELVSLIGSNGAGNDISLLCAAHTNREVDNKNNHFFQANIFFSVLTLTPTKHHSSDR